MAWMNPAVHSYVSNDGDGSGEKYAQRKSGEKSRHMAVAAQLWR
jgi:hypothetical protein